MTRNDVQVNTDRDLMRAAGWLALVIGGILLSQAGAPPELTEEELAIARKAAGDDQA